MLNRAMGEFIGDGGSWNAVRDAAGRTYYWDRLANATQWEAPTAEQVSLITCCTHIKNHSEILECWVHFTPRVLLLGVETLPLRVLRDS